MKTFLLLGGTFILTTSCGQLNKDKSKEEEDEQSEIATDPNANTVGTLSISGQLPANDKANTAIVFNFSKGGMNSSSASTTKIEAGKLAININKSNLLLGDDKDSASTSQVIATFTEGKSKLDSFDTIRFITTPTSNNETLTAIDMDKLKEDNLDLGKIEKKGDDLVGSTKISTENIDMSATTIEQTAATDDSVRLLKNIYANTDEKTNKSIQMALWFMWHYDARNAINKEVDPNTITYEGWGPELQSNRSDFQFDVLCGDLQKRKNLNITVPGDGVTPDASDPSKIIKNFTNNNAKQNENPATTDRRDCSVDNGYIAQSNGSDGVFMNFAGGNLLEGEIPKGVWNVSIDNTLVGKFDLAVANPIDLIEKHTKVFIPSVKLIVDEATNKVSKAEVYWYFWNTKEKKYIKVTDYEAMKQAVEYVTIGFDFSVNNQTPEYIHMDNALSRKFPENNKPWLFDVAASGQDWRINKNWIAGCPKPSENFKRVDMIGVDFGMYGNRYKFNFKMPGLDAGACP